MRFRKRINIGNHSHINVSKSGLSFSSGIPGASFTVGKDGTYINYGIPGTGLYDRKRINTSSNYYNTTGSSPNSNSMPREAYKYNFSQGVRIHPNEDGTIDFYDSDDRLIIESSVQRYIKNQPNYRSVFDSHIRSVKEESDAETSGFVDIYKRSIPVQKTSYYIYSLNSMKPDEYTPRAYPNPKPTKEDAIAELTKEAENSISALFSFREKSLRKQYVESNLDERYMHSLKAWEEEKKAYEAEQLNYKKMYDEYKRVQYNAQKEKYTLLIANDPEAVDKAINVWMQAFQVPFDFAVDYELFEDTIYLDLDLPEIEDLPEQYMTITSNGGLKTKDKTQKQLRKEYYETVLGIAVCVASQLFGALLGIQEIVISAYTQRRDKDGYLCDDYIYSVIFDRDAMSEVVFSEQTVEDVFYSFDNICLVNTNYSFKTITPFEHE